MVNETNNTNSEAGELPEVALFINAQYIKDLSFENPAAPQSLKNWTGSPQISLDIDVKARSISERSYEIILHLACHAKSETEQETVFIAELAYAGVFTLHEDVPENLIKPILMIEAPRLLFPFARAIIADLTREGGMPPLMINPIDFSTIYKEKMSAVDPAHQQAESTKDSSDSS